MLKVGDKAPDFELRNQQAELVSLEGLLAEGPLVLYFYPIDFSPVCTAQTCAMRDRYEGASVQGIQIVGVSPQGVESHKRFADMHSVPFPLLADPGKEVVKAYGVDGLFGFGTRRATFLIGTDRIVKNRAVADLTVGAHTDLLESVAEQTGA